MLPARAGAGTQFALSGRGGAETQSGDRLWLYGLPAMIGGDAGE